MEYTYSIATDTANAKVDSVKLTDEISASSITVNLNRIDTDGDSLKVVFDTSISAGEETTLTSLIGAHDGIPYPATPAPPKDSDGAPLVRGKVTKSGWHIQLHSMEISTATTNGFFNKDDNDNDLGFCTYTMKDSGGNTTTDPTQCVKTILDWECGYDYEIMGAFIRQKTAPTVDVRMWVIAAPDIPANFGGSKYFANGGLNLKHIDSSAVDSDGKAPKFIAYDPINHSGKFRMILTHPADTQHTFMLTWQIYQQ